MRVHLVETVLKWCTYQTHSIFSSTSAIYEEMSVLCIKNYQNHLPDVIRVNLPVLGIATEQSCNFVANYLCSLRLRLAGSHAL